MSRCTCRHCGPRGTKPVKVEVTITVAITRPGWESADVWGEMETEHELRAEVAYGSPNDAPEVSWLDQGRFDDLRLTSAEEARAIEQAAEAGYQTLMARGEQDEPREGRADYEYDRRRDERAAS